MELEVLILHCYVGVMALYKLLVEYHNDVFYDASNF